MPVRNARLSRPRGASRSDGGLKSQVTVSSRRDAARLPLLLLHKRRAICSMTGALQVGLLRRDGLLVVGEVSTPRYRRHHGTETNELGGSGHHSQASMSSAPRTAAVASSKDLSHVPHLSGCGPGCGHRQQDRPRARSRSRRCRPRAGAETRAHHGRAPSRRGRSSRADPALDDRWSDSRCVPLPCPPEQRWRHACARAVTSGVCAGNGGGHKGLRPLCARSDTAVSVLARPIPRQMSPCGPRRPHCHELVPVARLQLHEQIEAIQTRGEHRCHPIDELQRT